MSLTVVTLNIPLRQLTFTPTEAAWMTSMIPRGKGRVLPQLPKTCPLVSPPCPIINSFKCPTYTSCSRWSFNTRNCSVVWLFSLWYVQYKLWFFLVRSPPIFPSHWKYGSFFMRSRILWTGSLKATITLLGCGTVFGLLDSLLVLCWNPPGRGSRLY